MSVPPRRAAILALGLKKAGALIEEGSEGGQHKVSRESSFTVTKYL